MKNKIEIWIAVLVVVAFSFVSLFIGLGVGYLYQKGKIDACHKTLKVQAEGLSGLDGDSNLVEKKKDYDKCGVDLGESDS